MTTSKDILSPHQFYRGTTQAPFNFDDFKVNNFTGHGGASMGIEMAIDRMARSTCMRYAIAEAECEIETAVEHKQDAS
jgi:hypothetical protein